MIEEIDKIISNVSNDWSQITDKPDIEKLYDFTIK